MDFDGDPQGPMGVVMSGAHRLDPDGQTHANDVTGYAVRRGELTFRSKNRKQFTDARSGRTDSRQTAAVQRGPGR